MFSITGCGVCLGTCNGENGPFHINRTMEEQRKALGSPRKPTEGECSNFRATGGISCFTTLLAGLFPTSHCRHYHLENISNGRASERPCCSYFLLSQVDGRVARGRKKTLLAMGFPFELKGTTHGSGFQDLKNT